jgi:hypothetical protein
MHIHHQRAAPGEFAAFAQVFILFQFHQETVSVQLFFGSAWGIESRSSFV